MRRLLVDRTGATIIEYALMAALLALALVSAIGPIGDQNAALIDRAADALPGD